MLNTNFDFDKYSKEVNIQKADFKCCDSKICLDISNKNKTEILKIQLDEKKLENKYGKSCDFILIELENKNSYFIEIKTSGNDEILKSASEQIGNTIKFVNQDNGFILDDKIKLTKKSAYAYSKNGWGFPLGNTKMKKIIADFYKTNKTLLIPIQKNDKIIIDKI